MYNSPLPRRGLLSLSLEGACRGNGVVALPSIVWRVSAHNRYRYTPTPTARPGFLILKLIIYFRKPKDLSSSLIRGQLFSFRWEARSSLQAALEGRWEDSEGSSAPGCSQSRGQGPRLGTALPLPAGFPTPGYTFPSRRELWSSPACLYHGLLKKAAGGSWDHPPVPSLRELGQAKG